MIARPILVLVVAASLATSVRGTHDPPQARQAETFRGAADLVSIHATVVDRDRRLVPNLEQADFIVTDNGRPQPIVFFSSDVQPLSVVLMIDRSATMTFSAGVVRDAAIEFVRQLLPGDRARIGSFSDQIRVNPADFTGNQAELIDILRAEATSSGASPVWTAIDTAIDLLQPRSGRRVVLVLSDGHDYPAWNQRHTKLKDLMTRAKTSEVMIYAIGFPADTAKLSLAARGLPFGVPPGGTGTFRPNRPMSGRRVEPPDPALEDLAKASGGGYFELEDDAELRTTFARVAEELRTQYLLAFKPATLDGKVHDVEVRVRQRGMEVRARRQYLAPARSGG